MPIGRSTMAATALVCHAPASRIPTPEHMVGWTRRFCATRSQLMMSQTVALVSFAYLPAAEGVSRGQDWYADGRDHGNRRLPASAWRCLPRRASTSSGRRFAGGRFRQDGSGDDLYHRRKTSAASLRIEIRPSADRSRLTAITCVPQFRRMDRCSSPPPLLIRCSPRARHRKSTSFWNR